ncbi:MAG TPA: anti-sigma factor [Xanthobacteraceae bacterium]|nr:anti-sigma factor [Xanthobacteraceae bacterium]
MTPLTPHQEPDRLLHAYLDGELDPVNTLAVETRLARDPQLAAELVRLERLQRMIRHALPREAPSAALRARIEAAIGMRRRREFSWRALAASIMLTAVAAGGSATLLAGPTPTEMVRREVVAGHIRAVVAARPVDVASTDGRVVRPWFDGRHAGAPHVVDLAAAGFPLLGARLDVVAESRVPTLVYRDQTHLISLTTVPVAAGQALEPVHSRLGGYNVTRWIENGDCYWVVSDAAVGDLDRFARVFRAADAD